MHPLSGLVVTNFQLQIVARFYKVDVETTETFHPMYLDIDVAGKADNRRKFINHLNANRPWGTTFKFTERRFVWTRRLKDVS